MGFFLSECSKHNIKINMITIMFCFYIVKLLILIFYLNELIILDMLTLGNWPTRCIALLIVAYYILIRYLLVHKKWHIKSVITVIKAIMVTYWLSVIQPGITYIFFLIFINIMFNIITIIYSLMFHDITSKENYFWRVFEKRTH